MLTYINQIIKFKDNIDSLPVKIDEKKKLKDICNNITDCIAIDGKKVSVKDGKTEELLKSIDYFLKYISLILNSAIIDSSFNQTKD
jgi:hypothetical protein